MRMSCNGCRVLRKGCSDNCSIKPCLEWIKSPESQAHATLFLAKFYGRAGLINLVNSTPHHLRPATFRSLLYEACGRIVDPVHGSVGLQWTGTWHLCQAAVEAVLRGRPITQVSSSELTIDACDIRHAFKDADGLPKPKPKPKSQFKRPGKKRQKPRAAALEDCGWPSNDEEECWAPSRAGDAVVVEGDSLSVETVEPSLAEADEPVARSKVELDLDLSLGIKFN